MPSEVVVRKRRAIEGFPASEFHGSNWKLCQLHRVYKGLEGIGGTFYLSG